MARILVLCPNVWDKEALARPEIRADHQILFAGEELLEEPSLWKALRFDIFRYMRALVTKHRDERIDAVVGTGDYPGAMMAAFIGKELGLPAPDPKVITLLSHKYYSRELQRVSAPESVPDYCAIDPFAPARPVDGRRLGYPFFVKPVKGTMSIRARAVANDAELAEAVRTTLSERALLTMLLRPFQQLLDTYAEGMVAAHHFIGEGLLSGEQVTVDGFVQNGRAQIMGIVDSIMYPGTMSFMRFETPSRLPSETQERMRAIAARVLEASGLDHACFNIEMFHDQARDRIFVIEINPRMSYQFGDLYERIHGVNTYAVQLGLALGTPVDWAPAGGRDGAAASFVMRRFEDGRCTRVPTEEELDEIRERWPGATIKVLCTVGERLSDQDQDVGSYRYAIINMSARTAPELHEEWQGLERRLRFEFSAK